MLTRSHNFGRTSPIFDRSGFTLVELLVVIGIIAILAGVTLGPITNGIKKARQSAGVQQGHALGLAMYSYANDNSQVYPDVSGADAASIARLLLAGGYVTDPGIFYLSGDGNGASKFSATTPAATSILNANVTWDFMGAGGAGVSSVDHTYLPLLWSTLKAGTEPSSFTAQAATVVYTNSRSPFGIDGVAIFYINNSASFVTGNIINLNISEVTMVTASNDTSGAGPAYSPITGL